MTEKNIDKKVRKRAIFLKANFCGYQNPLCQSLSQQQQQRESEKGTMKMSNLVLVFSFVTT